MRRWIFFAFGVACHVFFLALYAAFAGFVAGVLVPKSIDSSLEGGASIDVLIAGAVDLALIGMFGLQHSIMARPWFKRWWTRYVPEAIERSTYVLVSCIALLVLMWQWRGIPLTIWDVQHPFGRAALWGLFVAGWLLVPTVTFMINHFDLFGTRQVWLHLQGKSYTTLKFRTPMLYRRMRHPLYLGWAIAFWATPTMTLGHLLFAATLTGYMVLATFFEEKDLVSLHGEEYREYQRQVPKFVPQLGWAGRGAASAKANERGIRQPATVES